MYNIVAIASNNRAGNRQVKPHAEGAVSKLGEIGYLFHYQDNQQTYHEKLLDYRDRYLINNGAHMDVVYRGGIRKYHYSFNGMERDDEVKGSGNSYTTLFRQYDPRIGRWLSLDPMETSFPWQSPYVAFDNNPILLNDPNGDCATCPENHLGAPVAQEGDITDNSFAVDAGWVSKHKDNNFIFRDKGGKYGYNFYWVEGEPIQKLDENGNTVMESQGTYMATPYMYVYKDVMVDPGKPAVDAVPAQFGWVNVGSRPLFQNIIFRFANYKTADSDSKLIKNTPANNAKHVIKTYNNALSYFNKVDADNGPALRNSNDKIIELRFISENYFSKMLIKSFESEGFTTMPIYSLGTKLAPITTLTVTPHLRFNYRFRTITNIYRWQQIRAGTPASPGREAIPAVPPTFESKWIWQKR